jgi:hypothetical protein
MDSPYTGKPEAEWPAVTRRLADTFPLPMATLGAAARDAWDLLYSATVVGGRLHFGVDLFPEPQVIGAFLHELIPWVVAERAAGWRRDQTGYDKDLVCLADERYSIEIKTSSDDAGFYGNRSYAQVSAAGGKKGKAGYYLVVNFPKTHKTRVVSPLTQVRFGWLDHTDWVGQSSPTGQQARVPAAVARAKLVAI